MTAFGPGQKIGKYELGNKLGHGGYGIVYAARDTELGRDLAIKFLRPDYASRAQVVQRFLQEARSAAKIVHPGIVTVYECGHVDGTGTEADGTIYIAMELLAGEDLGTRLDGGQLPIDAAIEIAIQISAALEAAHKSGIVHRDLKPDNIFLVPDPSMNGGERVKVLDFGIAKLADADRAATAGDTGSTGVHTHSMMMLGTPRYMSPEQCRSAARVDHRSDIYTLGCILFEMLCGHSPYDGDAGELIAKHQLAPIPRARSDRPEIPAYLDVLVSTMLSKEPRDRPPTMERVRAALVACAQGQPLPAGELTDGTPSSGETPDTTLGASAGARTLSREDLRARRWLIAGLAAMLPLGLVIGIVIAHRGKSPPAAKPPSPAAAVAAPPRDATAVDPADKELTCRKLSADRQWDKLLHCADALGRIVPPGSPVIRELTTMAVIEARNEQVASKVKAAVARADLANAYRWLDRIDDESVYKEEESEAVDGLASKLPDAAKPRHCNANRLAQRAQQAITQGMYTSALALIEGSLRCRPDSSLYRLALLAACNSGNAAKARRYFARLPASQQTPMAQLCLRNKIALP